LSSFRPRLPLNFFFFLSLFAPFFFFRMCGSMYGWSVATDADQCVIGNPKP
jgi:hypothetical protein